MDTMQELNRRRELTAEAEAFLKDHAASKDADGRVVDLARTLVTEARYERVLVQMLTAAISAQRLGYAQAVPPKELLEQLRNEPESVQLHRDCEDCALELQLKEAETCFACGGVVGWAAYHYKNEISVDKLRREIKASRRMGYPQAAERLEAMLERRLTNGPKPAEPELAEEAISVLRSELDESRERVNEAAEELARLGEA